MAIHFYCDAHIPKQVAEQLRKHDIHVVRCQDVGLDDATDEQHLHYAAQNNLAIITKDDDF